MGFSSLLNEMNQEQINILNKLDNKLININDCEYEVIVEIEKFFFEKGFERGLKKGMEMCNS